MMKPRRRRRMNFAMQPKRSWRTGINNEMQP
ncbi:unnamed protein product [Nippostrongylus brasiliensis]|uniref:Coat protein n=1 Tax=Nippostrongylus brasiliensis TaxID=27835 RepID=A0A0N4XQQ8_NIPBR|nr:unnamed protein product [Nippostrongylus brasiliensis]